jgi:glycosyltransferase involved in cell wall biosynthesis
MNPLVSIICPVYNAEKFLESSISSILNQTYQNWELLICNDASTDKSEEIIEKFLSDKRITYFGKSNSLGAFNAKNYLLKKAKGDYITFLDADDFIEKEKFDLQILAFSQNMNLGLVATQIRFVTEKSKLIRESKFPISYNEIMQKIFDVNIVGNSSMMIKKEVLDHVGGGFRKYFDRLSYQDYDLSLLIAEKYQVLVLNECLYNYRQHSNSISKVIDVDRQINKKIVQFLANQRRTIGKDFIMLNQFNEIEELKTELKIQYLIDETLIHREFAENYMYNKLNSSAIKVMLKALCKNPFSIANLKTLQYCLRKTIFV